MRLSLDDEPSAEEIEKIALSTYGFEYFICLLSGDQKSCQRRLDIEHSVEQQLIRERSAAMLEQFE